MLEQMMFTGKEQIQNLEVKSQIISIELVTIYFR